MKFIVKKNEIVDALSISAAIAERRQTIPILANLRIVAKNSEIEVTATDLEIQIKSKSKIKNLETPGETTVSARKMSELCRSLPENEDLTFELKENGKLSVSAKNFHADFATLSTNDFPELDIGSTENSLELDSGQLKNLLTKTSFCMASQDVRYYLNGLLLEFSDTNLTAVATDGHRLASATYKFNHSDNPLESSHILPRKAALELSKILSQSNESISLTLSESGVGVKSKDFDFSSKLIDGKFPEYKKVFPQGEPSKLIISKEHLNDALSRASVLSNEKYRGVRFELEKDSLKLTANNPEQEFAEEVIETKYSGIRMEIGFNIGYLLDVIGSIDSETLEISFFGEESSCLINEPKNLKEVYVIMPMRL